jgi:hypothetical protein
MGARTFGRSFGFEYFGGSGVSTLDLTVFPVFFGQYPYNLDLTSPFSLQTIPYIRQQSDQSESPGEQSLNPAGLWRRSASSWHLGAGQTHYDRPNSSEYRFDNSLGMFIWNKWELSLLPDTDAKVISSNTNMRLAVAGTDLYWTDGTALKRTTNINVDTPTFTALTGSPPANAPTSIVSDGFNVWTAHGTNGIWKTTRGTLAWAGAAHITGTVSLLGFVRGRVLAANGPSVYDVTALAQGGGGALPIALFTHPNTDFVWKAFAEGRNAVYMAGYSGDKSLIYKSTIKSDGTGLDAPTVAGELPDGELVESLYGYLGPFFFIGLSGIPGWRFALVNQNGDLRIGARVDTPSPVLCFEGQENFVYFGWGNYDATHTGIGRASISEFGDPDGLVPAYASDLMLINQTANINSIVTFQGSQVFTVHATTIAATHHSGNKVSTGTLDTGSITYNMNQDKIGLYVDFTHETHQGGTHSLAVSLDNGLFVDLGTHEEHMLSFVLGEARARSFELRIGLQRDATDLTISQILTSWLLRAQMVPSVSQVWTIPLLLSDTVDDLDGNAHPMDPWERLSDIHNLTTNKTVVQLIVNGRGFPVIPEEYNLVFSKLTDDKQGKLGFNATCNVQLKNLAETL